MVSSTLYASFLVRLWRKGGQPGDLPRAPWQGEVEHIQTNRRWTFDTLDELLSFLHRQTEEADSAETGRVQIPRKEKDNMTKVVQCRDLGFDCDGVVRAETEAEVLEQVAAHAKSVHHLETVTEAVVEKVRQVMREE